MIRHRLVVCLGLGCIASGGVAPVAVADTLSSAPTLNYFGLPGLVDMPNANAMPDADLAFTGAYLDGTSRGTLAFQVLPQVTATFRYSAIPEFTPNTSPINQDYYLDRSFDLHWQVIDEENWWPSLAVGIRDIAGTGVYGGEYIVATRHFGASDQLAVTAGLGFGRLGERDGFANPFGLGDRPVRDFGSGGTITVDQFFRGDAALFGGIEYQATDRLRLQLEYSSDLYLLEVDDNVIEIDSPINVGATYDLNEWGTIGAHYLYGSTFGLSYSISTNPRHGAVAGSLDAAPLPVRPRVPSSEGYPTNWVAQADGPPILRDNIERLFEDDGGLEFVSLGLDPHRATIRVRNIIYPQEAQALGRVLRVMSVTMPRSIEVFEVIFVVNGADTSRVRVNRSDVEALEHDVNGASGLLARAEVETSGRVRDPDAMSVIGSNANRLTWSIAPYVETSLFDPENPLLADIGIQAEAQYEFGRGFLLDGSLRVPVFGNLDESRTTPIEPGGPFPVRSEAALYHQESDAHVERLTLSHYGQLGGDLYTRLTFGYLERMFAGASGEILWQRPDSDLGIGLELNHVWRRDFDGGFGLQDYSVTTGHVSAYFPVFDTFTGQVDVGRYLAGDYGATFRLDRDFANGWSVGAFATFTDVSFDEFGEGSFDKGIELTIPTTWFFGDSSRETVGTTLRPIQRDGGAMLNVNGRLHDMITDYHRPNLEETEGMLWR